MLGSVMVTIPLSLSRISQFARQNPFGHGIHSPLVVVVEHVSLLDILVSTSSLLFLLIAAHDYRR
jgi:hypothetical protein